MLMSISWLSVMPKKYRFLKNAHYRVLFQKGDQIDTWDYDEQLVAERAYYQLTNWDRRMMILVWSNNVSCIKDEQRV